MHVILSKWSCHENNSSAILLVHHLVLKSTITLLYPVSYFLLSAQFLFVVHTFSCFLEFTLILILIWLEFEMKALSKCSMCNIQLWVEVFSWIVKISGYIVQNKSFKSCSEKWDTERHRRLNTLLQTKTVIQFLISLDD